MNKGDWRQSVNLFEENTYKSNFKKVEKLKDIAKRKGTRIIACSFSMVIKPKGIDTVIPGGKRAEQIRESVRAVEVSLNEDVMKEIESILED